MAAYQALHGQRVPPSYKAELDSGWSVQGAIGSDVSRRASKPLWLLGEPRPPSPGAAGCEKRPGLWSGGAGRAGE